MNIKQKAREKWAILLWGHRLNSWITCWKKAPAERLLGCSLPEHCPPCVLSETGIPLEKMKTNMVFNLLTSMDMQKVTQNSASLVMWALYDFAILHDLLSPLTEFYLCEPCVTTALVTKNNGHLQPSDLINYQPIICILLFIKNIAEAVSKGIPKDLVMSEHLDPSQPLYLHGQGRKLHRFHGSCNELWLDVCACCRLTAFHLTQHLWALPLNSCFLS